MPLWDNLNLSQQTHFQIQGLASLKIQPNSQIHQNLIL